MQAGPSLSKPLAPPVQPAAAMLHCSASSLGSECCKRSQWEEPCSWGLPQAKCMARSAKFRSSNARENQAWEVLCLGHRFADVRRSELQTAEQLLYSAKRWVRQNKSMQGLTALGLNWVSPCAAFCGRERESPQRCAAWKALDAPLGWDVMKKLRKGNYQRLYFSSLL